ncbi:hypothetical protein LJC42_05640 [Eubacteriales bacterium OttesenSCG-928-K08]|nr:hypothetical protein [Eubacteriales bacterium OttesenSCG-928-K08]
MFRKARPTDVEQREGRIERQGNENDEVDIYRYVKEGSFDSFLWQTVETKQKFISQVMTGRTPVRSCEDMDEAVLNYAEVKALAAGDPDIKERMQLDTDIKRLKLLQSNYLSNKYELEDMVNKHYPARIAQLTGENEAIRKDIALYAQHQSDEFPGMELCGMQYSKKDKAGAALLETCKAQTNTKPHPVGKYCGFTLLLSFDPIFKRYTMYLEGNRRYELELGSDIHGNIQRLDNCLKGMPDTVARNEQTISEIKRQMENATVEIAKPFTHEFDLAQKQARLIELDAKLKIGETFNEAIALDEPEGHVEREEIVMER